MSRLRLRLPATSANLGPGFDTLALALELFLEIEAEPTGDFVIEATGRNAALCSALENNLLLTTYRELLQRHGRPVLPLRVRMANGIPVGMGCGSSAAVRLAAAALASHFGGMEWPRERILAEACRLEGHPDNASACWLGGFVASATEGELVRTITLAPPAQWRAVIAMPERPLATTASRAVLPESYAKQEVVGNLQCVGLLTAAFAAGRADLLATGMRDRLHQPYRAEVCSLLPRLLPLAGQGGAAGVSLSGAGPAVLLLSASAEAASEAMRNAAKAVEDLGPVEFIVCGLHDGAADMVELAD